MAGRSALIVGASRGLGLGLAGEFASRGWQVIATARDPSAAPGLRMASAASGGRIAIEALDILAPADLAALVRRLDGVSLDLLLINAGIAGPKHQSVDEVTGEELAHLMLSNAIAPLRTARRMMPLVKAGGTVAFMSSRMGSVADNTSGDMDLYRASKAALNSLTRGFAATVAAKRMVQVLSLHPGWVRTDMGGPTAPLSVEQSVRGLADVLERGNSAGRGSVPQHRFVDYSGQELPW